MVTASIFERGAKLRIIQTSPLTQGISHSKVRVVAPLANDDSQLIQK
jgi:hypothetical protein